MNTVLFVNATIVFSENLVLVSKIYFSCVLAKRNYVVLVRVSLCVYVCICEIGIPGSI